MAYASWSVTFGEQPSAAKWNILGTNDSSFNDGTGIAASAITPEKLFTGTGATWPWQSWTPTWTNLTVGNGTQASTYRQIGKTVHFKVSLTFGTTTSVSGGIIFTLPVTSISYISNVGLGWVNLGAAGGTTAHLLEWATTTTCQTIVLNAASTNLSRAATSSSSPAIWTTGDKIVGLGFYEAA